MSTKALERAQEVLARDRRLSLGFVQQAGAHRTQQLLQETARDLELRLKSAELLRGPGKDTFSIAQMRATLAQVRSVLKPLMGGVKDTLLTHGPATATEGAEHAAKYLVAADKAFKGVGQQPLALRTALMLEAAGKGSAASILARLAGEPGHPGHLGVLQRYGVETIGHFEGVLQRGLLGRKSWADVRQDLTAKSPFLQGAPAFWAHRIVRTEMMAAQNRGQHEAIVEADEQLGDMCKIVSCVFDDRTGADSVAIHGQIRRPEEPFESWNGAFQHPPDRPNDRASVTPHRLSWPIPPYLAWASAEEIEKAWKRDGRKGAPPERPLMTTIPLDSFGKRQGKKPEEEQESASVNEDHGEPEVPEREAAESQAPVEEAPWHDPGIPEIPERGPVEPQAPIEEAEFEKPPEPILVPPAEEAPEPEPEKPELTADEILATKDAGAKGSNLGGFYTGTDGVQRYVKFYQDPAQAFCEHLSNQMYRDLGFEAPESTTFGREDGTTAYASKIVDGLKTVKDVGLTVTTAKQVMHGFAADVLLGNWDAVGTGLDNVGVVGDKVMRVDNGGSLLFRAKAGRKPMELLNQITEWDKFLSSSANPYYSQVASKAGVAKATDLGKDLVAQIGNIKNLQKESGGWAKYVEKHAADMPEADKKRVVEMLEARTKLLAAKVKETKAAAKQAKVDAKAQKLADKESKLQAKEFAKIAKKLGGAPPQNYDDMPRDDAAAQKHFKTENDFGLGEIGYRHMAEKSVALAQEHHKGPVEFTGSAYGAIREYEKNPTAGASNNAKKYAKDIEQFMAKATPAPPGTIYRGITDIGDETLKRFCTGSHFTFDATSSCSRTGAKAKSFGGGARERGQVYFVLDHKTAVPVETISQHGSENELFVRKGTSFWVTRRYRHEGAVVIEAREMTAEELDKVRKKAP